MSTHLDEWEPGFQPDLSPPMLFLLLYMPNTRKAERYVKSAPGSGASFTGVHLEGAWAPSPEGPQAWFRAQLPLS